MEKECNSLRQPPANSTLLFLLFHLTNRFICSKNWPLRLMLRYIPYGMEEYPMGFWRTIVSISILVSVSALPVTASALEGVSARSMVLLNAWFRGQGALERVEERIRGVREEIARNDATIQKASSIVAQATARGNDKAKAVATEALEKARRSREKNEVTRAEYEKQRLALRRSLATIQNLMGEGGGSSPVTGVVTGVSGRVELFRKGGEKVTLSGVGEGFLQAGDEIITYGDGRLEFQMLDGRGTTTVGPYTRVRMVEESPERVVMEQLKGKVYTAIDSLDTWVDRMKQGYQSWRRDLDTVSTADWKELRRYLEEGTDELKLRLKHEIETRMYKIKTPTAICGVRGTRFDVEVTADEGTRICVEEGVVAVSDPSETRTFTVKGGETLSIDRKGVDGPVATGKVTGWWEK